MMQNCLKSFLAVAALSVAASNAMSFEWQPAIQTPNPAFDVTAVYAVERLTFLANGVDGAATTDVMPLWVDEEGNEIAAHSGVQNPNGWDPQEFSYSFSISDFKGNGEYTLVFPEGLIVNAAGEKSDRLEWFYTFDVSELASGMFEDFEVLSITPDLSQSQAIWADQVVTINTNHNDAIGLTKLTITDTTTGEVVVLSSSYASGRIPGDDSPISWEVVGSYKFYEAHTYRADFVFYNGNDEVDGFGERTKIVDRAAFEFTGRVEGYRYSPVQLMSVDPIPGQVLISEPSQAVFTYTFSGPVTIYQAETPLGQNGKNVYPKSCLSSNDDKTVWTLDLSSDSFLKSESASVIINVYANDLDGLHVQGNEGSEGNSCFQYEWECELGGTSLSIVSPASGACIEKLTEVVVKAIGGDKISWSWLGSASLRRSDGSQIGRLYYEGGDAASQVRFSQWIPAGASTPQPLALSEEGSYVIDFSHGCFYSGPDSNSKQSRSVSSSFSIENGGETPSFADFTILSITPDLSEAQGEWTDQSIAINTNHNDAVGLVTLSVLDKTDGVNVLTSDNSAMGRAPGDVSDIYWTVSGSYKFLKGHEYSAEFVFYNGRGDADGHPGDLPEVGRVSYLFAGAVETEPVGPTEPEFKYSPFSLVSIEPAPEEVEISTPEMAVFKYAFSGPLSDFRAVSSVAGITTVDYPASCISSNEDKTVWTLDLSANAYVLNLNGKLVIYIYARDVDGYQLQGNQGIEEYSCFRYEWECKLGNSGGDDPSQTEPDPPAEPEFNYSLLTLESVDPAPGVSVDNALFRYTFTGPVTVDCAVSPIAGGQNVVYPESCLSSNAEKTVWTLDLSGNEYVRNLDGPLVICVYAKDGNGDQLQGNYGDKEDSCYRYEWDCRVGAIAVSVVSPAQDSVVESLTEVSVKSADGLPLNWIGSDALVLNAEGKEIGKIQYVASADVDAADTVRFAWWIPASGSQLEPLYIEEKGDYTVAFPTACFLVGNEADSKRSRAVSSSFAVSGRTYSRLSLISVSPEPTSEVISSPDQAVIRYTFSGPVVVDKAVTPLDSGEVREYPASSLSSSEDRTLWTLDLSSDDYVLGLDGQLIISLYARDLEGYPIEGNSGEGEESCFLYQWGCTIGALPEATDSFVFGFVDPENGAAVESLSQVRISYVETAIPLVDSVDVYEEGEDTPVCQASLVSDEEDDSVVRVVFDDPIAEAGVYTVEFPAGVVGNLSFAESEGKTGFYNPAFYLVYTIEPADDAVDILTEVLGLDIFDINGRLVVSDADASALGRLAKGIYICNGKKIIIK